MRQKKNYKILKNVIGVGGFPGVGKSTLVGFFAKLGYKVSYEFNKTDDEILLALLKKYFKGYYDGYLLQIGFLNNVFNRYKKKVKLAKEKKPVFIDRTIVESLYFAKGQIKNEILFELYNYEHQKKYNLIKEEIGLPELYIHLTTTLEDAFERLKARNKDEYREKIRNKENFKIIYENYSKHFQKEIEDLGISYLEINTKHCNQQEVAKYCKKELVKRGLINELIE